MLALSLPVKMKKYGGIYIMLSELIMKVLNEINYMNYSISVNYEFAVTAEVNKNYVRFVIYETFGAMNSNRWGRVFEAHCYYEEGYYKVVYDKSSLGFEARACIEQALGLKKKK